MFKTLIPATCVFACLAVPALAQQVRPPVERPAERPGVAARPSSTEQTLEQNLAACLIISNQEEIALAQFALDNTKNEKVRDFAETLIKDHSKFVSKLRKFSPQNAAFELQIKTEGKAAKDEPRDKAAPVATENRTAPGAPGDNRAAPRNANLSFGDQMLAIHRDAAQECYNMTTKELKDKKGEEFDMCFMTGQAHAHVGMIAKMKAIEGKVSGEFADLMKEGQESAHDHLDHAKKILESHKDDGKTDDKASK